jgi:hypothetical protein
VLYQKAMETFNLGVNPDKYLVIKKSKIDFSYQELGLEMQEFFPLKDRPRIWGSFYKYDERKIRDAFITCQKQFRATNDNKFKNINYLIGIVKKL